VNTLTLALDGLKFFKDDFQRKALDLLLGANLSYINSALSPGTSDDEDYGTARSFAFDLGTSGIYAFEMAEGYQNRIGIKLILGGVIKNMGPKVFYVDREAADPIGLQISGSFTTEVALGDLSYILKKVNPNLIVGNLSSPIPLVKVLFTRDHLVHVHEVDSPGKPTFFLKSLGRYFSDPWGSRYENRRENYFGWEAEWLNCLAFRVGRLKDPGGGRNEHHSGVGLKLPFPIIGFELNYDRSEILERNDSIRGAQKSKTISVTYQGPFRWK
jgi:hypothetical protein